MIEIINDYVGTMIAMITMLICTTERFTLKLRC